jgi:hypothetical protein
VHVTAHLPGRDYRPDAAGDPPTLMLGYAETLGAAIRAGVREIAEAVPAARARAATSSAVSPAATS